MKTICLASLKGGVGKTSSCFHLSTAYRKLGLRVLLVDNDPQASLSQGFFGPSGTSAIDPRCSAAVLYRPESDPDPSSLVLPTGVDGVDILPGSIALNAHNLPREAGWGDGQWGLRSFLAEVAGRYDVCLIDCPPNLCLCSWSAMLASDFVVTPLQAEDFGSQGLAPVQAAVAAALGPNPSLRLLGYLLTMYDARLTIHQTFAAMLRELYGPLVFAAAVPRSKDFVEGVAARTPVGLYKPKSVAARAVAAVAAEILLRAEDAGRGRGAA